MKEHNGEKTIQSRFETTNRRVNNFVLDLPSYIYVNDWTTITGRSRVRKSVGSTPSVLKEKYVLEKFSLNGKFFTCIVILDHSFGLGVFK